MFPYLILVPVYTNTLFPLFRGHPDSYLQPPQQSFPGSQICFLPCNVFPGLSRRIPRGASGPPRPVRRARPQTRIRHALPRHGQHTGRDGLREETDRAPQAREHICGSPPARIYIQLRPRHDGGRVSVQSPSREAVRRPKAHRPQEAAPEVPGVDCRDDPAARPAGHSAAGIRDGLLLLNFWVAHSGFYGSIAGGSTL